MLGRSAIASEALPRPQTGGISAFLFEVWIIARCGVRMQSRARTWLFNTSFTPFFLLAPLVFLAQSFTGRDGRFRHQFVELTGYENYIGYMVIPLIDATLTNTVYSAIGQLIRQEQMAGTLERSLISMRYPVSLVLGRSLGNIVLLAWFGLSALFLSWFFFDLQLHVNVTSGLLLLGLHLLLVYGVAFFMTSLFLWIEDAFFVQQLFSRFVLLTLTGATFPITIFPEWLQFIAKLIPFTWLYQLERRAFLRAEPVSTMQGDLLILTGMIVFLWVVAFVFFHFMLQQAKRTGRLGLY